MMRAARVHPKSDGQPWSSSDAAPSSALHIDNVPIPEPSQPGEILVRVKATTVVRDMLTWPETLEKPYQIPGSDFAGVVKKVFPGDSTEFKIGDDVFGMFISDANRGGTWAEHTVVKSGEAAKMPTADPDDPKSTHFSYQLAATVPLTALTAYQALFHHSEIRDLKLNFTRAVNKAVQPSGPKILVTGAGGAVGIWTVQFALLAGCQVVCATSSNTRNMEYLLKHGAGQENIVEYKDLPTHSLSGKFDAVIDTVGGESQRSCFPLVHSNGVIVSVESASFNIEEEYKKSISAREGVKAKFFIVEPSGSDLADIAKGLQAGTLSTEVAAEFDLEDAKEAYELGNGRSISKGKVIVTM